MNVHPHGVKRPSLSTDQLRSSFTNRSLRLFGSLGPFWDAWAVPFAEVSTFAAVGSAGDSLSAAIAVRYLRRTAAATAPAAARPAATRSGQVSADDVFHRGALTASAGLTFAAVARSADDTLGATVVVQ
jgi:hypothetical protein